MELKPEQVTEEQKRQPWMPLHSVPPGQPVLTAQGLVGVRLEERWPGEAVWVYVASETILYRLHKSHEVQRYLGQASLPATGGKSSQLVPVPAGGHDGTS